MLRPGGRTAVVCWGDPQKFQLMTSLMRAVQTVVPDFQPPPGPPVWARLTGTEALKDRMQAAGFRQVEVTSPTRILSVESPQKFWTDFTSAVPPLAHLFQQIGPERTAAVGRTFIESLAASSSDGTPGLSAEGCIGIGRA